MSETHLREDYLKKFINLSELIQENYLKIKKSISLGESTQIALRPSTLRIRITEEPLTLSNLTTILSAFTRLATKCWLIANDRFFDLIEYTQTHDVRFTEEAQIIVTQVSYNSPFGMNVNFPNLDPKNIAEAIKEAVDTVTQAKQRLKQAELDTQTKAVYLRQAEEKANQDFLARAQELDIALQKATQEHTMGLFEQEKQQFELEKQRTFLQIELDKQKIDIQRQQVALQKEYLELEHVRTQYAIEGANIVINRMSPGIDQSVESQLPFASNSDYCGRKKFPGKIPEKLNNERQLPRDEPTITAKERQ